MVYESAAHVSGGEKAAGVERLSEGPLKVVKPVKRASKKTGNARKYEDWMKEELYLKAKKVGIEGRSRMSKAELVEALRRYWLKSVKLFYLQAAAGH